MSKSSTVCYIFTALFVVVGVVELAIHHHPFLAFFLMWCFPTTSSTTTTTREKGQG